MPSINGAYSRYYSQSARDASPEHADAIERSALEHAAYYVLRGDLDSAKRMLTRSYGESLIGNDGD